jgi:hypothetical protein
MSGADETTAQRLEAGFAHVATLSFVAARVVPGFGFPVALVGGTAVAHATERLGGRRGFAAGIAAAIESVAILGPARMSGPGGQLITAPLIGILYRRGRGRVTQIAACTAVRALFNVLTSLVFIAIVAGGIDNYAGTYDATLGRIPGAPEGTAAALILTGAALAIWAVGASWAQVAVFHRARRAWLGTELDADMPTGGAESPAGAAAAEAEAEAIRADADPPTAPGAAADPPTAAGAEATDAAGELAALHIPGPAPLRRRFDPRAVTAAALVAFALLLASTDPLLLGAVGAWLLVAWLLAPSEAEVVRPGLALAATIAVGAFVANWVGGDSVSGGIEHAARGALLVMTATWMRGAAGTDGVREVAHRILIRLRRLRTAGELRTALDAISGDRRMGAAIRALIDELRVAGSDVVAVLDAAIAWIAAEASRFRPGSPLPRSRLSPGPLDGLLLLGSALPALAFAAG